MIITNIMGNIYQDSKWQGALQSDYLDLEWYELSKRLLRKPSRQQRDVRIQLAKNQFALSEGDILLADDNGLLLVNVLPCECIAVNICNAIEMAKVCYEIGNRHAPLYFHPDDENTLLLPTDMPLMQLLKKMGCHTSIVFQKLINRVGGGSNHHDSHTHASSE